ncbi:MATE family efflux transporter [Acholeplasma sp. OttesenSCG-928-E16]|nr:MATE family efflux transporter [Acholeplasma sp. OttesenSCG-928-E16]
MDRRLIEGPILKSIIWFMIPVLIGGLLQQLYNMVDTVIIGHQLGNDALAGVQQTSSLSFLVIGFSIGMANGFSVIVAQRFGAKDEEGIKTAIATSLFLSLIVGIILTVLAVSFSKQLLILINTPNSHMEHAQGYILMIYAGIIATMSYNLISALLRALGNSFMPLLILGIAAVTNIILDSIFIFGLGFGTWSAGLATVLSQLLSAVVSFIYCFKKYPILRVRISDFKKITLSSCLNQLKMGFPMAVMFSITSISSIVLQGTINNLEGVSSNGELQINAYGNSIRLEQLINQPLIAVGVTMASFCGQNYGAKNFDRIKKGLLYAVTITMIYSILTMILVKLFGKYINYLFLNPEDVGVEQFAEIMALSNRYLSIVSWFFPFLALIFTFRNSIQAIGDPITPAIGAIIELTARIVACLVLVEVLDDKYLGVCLASPIAWFGAGTLLLTRVIIFMVKGKKNPYFLKNEEERVEEV